VKPASAKLVLLCLADAHNSETGRCFPSATYIARKTGQDKKTVYSSIEKLEAQGFISVERSQGKCPLYDLNLTQERVYPKTGTPENGYAQKRVDTLPENGETPYPKTGNEPVINQELSVKKQEGKKSEPPEYVQFAGFMWSRIQPITGSNRKPDFEKWAKHIRLLVEKDGRSLATVGDDRAHFIVQGFNFLLNVFLLGAKLKKLTQLRLDVIQRRSGLRCGHLLCVFHGSHTPVRWLHCTAQ